MSRYAFFWGCTIPARYPFMEKSIRMVLSTLGVDFGDLAGFTCCPEKTMVKNQDPEVWRTMAARNVAVAEEAGVDLMAACTGCYSTLKSVSSRLHAYPMEAEEVNGRLARIDLQYRGTADIKHIVEVFHDEVGVGKIRDKVVYPLTGLRIAVHGGCHLVRPSSAIHFDDPFKPTKYDTVVEALGAISVDTKTKMICCGGYLTRVGQQEMCYDMALVKLKDLMDNDVDAMTTTCPECFKVYDNFQQMIQRRGEPVNVPVLTITELMGLAFGFSPEELGLKEHRVSCKPLLEKFEAARMEAIA